MSGSGPSLRIDLKSPIPVYRQIVSALRALLVAGELAPETLLPSVRDLAMDLGVHHNTVAEAYRILADEGWLDLRRRRGAMVIYRSDPRAPRGAREDFARRLKELVAEARARGVSIMELDQELAAAKKQLT
jgi:GntR family transcriptional regulator